MGRRPKVSEEQKGAPLNTLETQASDGQGGRWWEKDAEAEIESERERGH